MEKKLIKVLPILLIAIVIINAICSSINNIPDTVETYITLAKTVLITYLTSFIVFYVDFKKNKSAMSILGLVGIAVCIILTIIYTVKVNSDIKTTNYHEIKKIYESVKTYSKLQMTVTQIIGLLRLIVIIRLISINTTDSIAQLSKAGAYLTLIINKLINTVGIWKEIETKSFIYKVGDVSGDLCTILVVTFIIFQLLAEEEKELLTKEKIEEPIPEQKPIGLPPSNGLSFRNPAQEELDARIAAEKAQQKLEQQSVQNTMNPQTAQNQFLGQAPTISTTQQQSTFQQQNPYTVTQNAEMPPFSTHNN